MSVKTVTLCISEEAHRKLKIKVARDGRKIRDYVSELIERDVASTKEVDDKDYED